MTEQRIMGNEITRPGITIRIDIDKDVWRKFQASGIWLGLAVARRRGQPPPDATNMIILPTLEDE